MDAFDDAASTSTSAGTSASGASARRPTSPSLWSAAEKAAAATARAAAPVVENPKWLPLWERIQTGGKTPVWQAIIGQHYWHPVHHFEGVGVKKGNDVGFARVCVDCGTPTKSLASAHCATHGGKKGVNPECTAILEDGAKCTRGGRHRVDAALLCSPCWVAAEPALRGCPQCLTYPRVKSRDDGLCQTCVKGNEVQLRRGAQRPALEALMREEGLDEWPGYETAIRDTRYATLNHMSGQAPYVCIVKSGWKQSGRACEVRGCLKVAATNPLAGETRFCVTHGGGLRCKGYIDHQDGVEKPCYYNHTAQKGESDTQVDYEGRCAYCYCRTFPDSEKAKNAKRHAHVKELAVRAWLEEHYSDVGGLALRWVFDRTVEGTRRRPDGRPLLHMLGINSHDVVLEVDERSHWFYLCADERVKEKDVHHWLSESKKPLIWIRFNPDAYDDPVTGERVASCFYIGKDGVCRPKPTKAAEWEQRLAKLGQILEEYLVDHADDWAAMEAAAEEKGKPLSKNTFVPIELFYDDVLVKQGEAKAQLDAFVRAGKERKARKRKRTAGEGPSFDPM